MFSAEHLRDWALLLVCNLIWASQFVMVKLVQEQMGPVFATFFPMTLATLFLIPVVWHAKRGASGNHGRLPTRDMLEFILIGVFGQVVAQLFITWGVRWSLASNAALLMLTLPVSTAVMAYFLLGERMTRVRWISFALAIIGVLECSGLDWKQLNFTSVTFLLGNLMIFLSVNGSAFYNAYSKKLLRRYSPLEVLLYGYYAVFVFLCPITIYVEPQGFTNLSHYNTTVWVGLAMLALFQYFLSMVIFLNVLTRLDATQAAVSNYLIPFFGVVIAAIVLHERLTGFMIAGGILVLASTLLVTVYEERQRARETAGVGCASQERPPLNSAGRDPNRSLRPPPPPTPS
jgi:drug/metabolite transporter (DMT)-like permease